MDSITIGALWGIAVLALVITERILVRGRHTGSLHTGPLSKGGHQPSPTEGKPPPPSPLAGTGVQSPRRSWLSYHEDRGVIIGRDGKALVWPDGECLGIDPFGIVAADIEQRQAQQMLELVRLTLKGDALSEEEDKKRLGLSRMLAQINLPDDYQEILERMNDGHR